MKKRISTKKRFIVRIVSILLLTFPSCVCVPEIETPKIVVPTEFATIQLINAIWGNEEYTISSEYGNIISGFKYGDSTQKKVAAGLNNLKLVSGRDSTILYNAFASFTKDLHYTFILFGTPERLQALLLCDTISNYISNNVYLRCVHVATGVPAVIFNLKDAYNIPINCRYRESSEFMPIPSGNFNIEIVNSETNASIVSLNNVPLKSEKKYYLILRGLFSNNNYNKVSSQLIEF